MVQIIRVFFLVTFLHSLTQICKINETSLRLGTDADVVTLEDRTIPSLYRTSLFVC